MSFDLPPPLPQEEEGAPAWVMTFADLMSLLMCFFVLLLAFSEMDVLKFKQIAGSMEYAFGVQREIKTKEIPKGTSIIAKEFSPGKPDPTALAQVRQHTTDEMERFLQIEEQGKGQFVEEGATSEEERERREEQEHRIKEVYVHVKADASMLEQAFDEEVDRGLIDIETHEDRIIIRIREEGSFPSGSAVMKGGFKPVMRKLSTVLGHIRGQIIVAGHTDNVPIATTRFRSNWELSAARAVSVLHHLRETSGIGEDRFLIEGHAESRPLVPNDSDQNRAKNRRVEIIVVQSPADVDTNRALMRDSTVDAEPRPEGGSRDG